MYYMVIGFISYVVIISMHFNVLNYPFNDLSFWVVLFTSFTMSNFVKPMDLDFV